MQLIIRVLFIIIFTIMILSCGKNSNQLEKESLEDIIAFIINENSIPMPPPAIFEGDSIVNTISKKTTDSIKSISLNVAIYPSIRNLSIAREKDINKKFLKVVLKDYVDLEVLNKKSKHHVIFADTLILNKSIDWKAYDLLFYFSKISVNENFDEAEISVGISRSALWGQAYDFFFVKGRDGKWKIKKAIEKEKW